MNHLEPRVAIVTGGVPCGGTTTFLCNLGGELLRRGIPVQILSFEKANPLASDFERLNLPVLCLDERRDIFEDRMRTVLDHLARFRPTVVLANLAPLSFEVLRYVPPGVFRMGAVQSDDPAVYETARHYVGVMDAIAAVSATIKKRIEADVRFASVPAKHLPYGVPMVEEVASRDPNRSQPLQILYLGRVDQEQKRVRLFPEILNHLKAADIPFHWTIAGDGPELPYLQSNMRTARSDQSVSFLGAIPYSKVQSVLAEHNVFLLASDYEGLPLSLLEAMGHGLVPVVSDLPSGIPEVVSQNTGKLVATNNTAGYAKAIIALHNDRDELNRLSGNARERVHREFSIGAMADRWLNVFPNEVSKYIVWPDRWKIKAPLVARSAVQFLPCLRPFRRLIKQFSRNQIAE